MAQTCSQDAGRFSHGPGRCLHALTWTENPGWFACLGPIISKLLAGLHPNFAWQRSRPNQNLERIRLAPLWLPHGTNLTMTPYPNHIFTAWPSPRVGSHIFSPLFAGMQPNFAWQRAHPCQTFTAPAWLEIRVAHMFVAHHKQAQKPRSPTAQGLGSSQAQRQRLGSPEASGQRLKGTKAQMLREPEAQRPRSPEAQRPCQTFMAPAWPGARMFLVHQKQAQ